MNIKGEIKYIYPKLVKILQLHSNPVIYVELLTSIADESEKWIEKGKEVMELIDKIDDELTGDGKFYSFMLYLVAYNILEALKIKEIDIDELLEQLADAAATSVYLRLKDIST